MNKVEYIFEKLAEELIKLNPAESVLVLNRVQRENEDGSFNKYIRSNKYLSDSINAKEDRSDYYKNLLYYGIVGGALSAPIAYATKDPSIVGYGALGGTALGFITSGNKDHERHMNSKGIYNSDTINVKVTPEAYEKYIKSFQEK